MSLCLLKYLHIMERYYFFLWAFELHTLPLEVIRKNDCLHFRFDYKKYEINNKQIIINTHLIVDMSKSKQISKQNNKFGSKKKQEKKPVTNEQGDPLIKNLSDFVTSIKVGYSSKPIYTGGRIIAMEKNLYSCCNNQITIYSFDQGAVVDRIKHMNEEIVNFGVCPQQKYAITYTESSIIRVMLIESKKIISTTKMNGFANDIQFSPDGRYLALAVGNTVHIFTFQTMKRTHTYNPTNSKFTITKLQWHPNPDKLQIVTCDMQRNIAVFDYIINKVIGSSQAGDGGTQFCIPANGDHIIAVNNLQVKIYDARHMKVKTTITTNQYMESLLAIDNMLYLGGQQTELYSINLASSSYKMKLQEGCADNGVSKLMSIGKTNSKRVLVVSIEQNITVARASTGGLTFQGIIVGYNDQIIDIKHSKTSQEQDQEECPYFVLVTNSNNIKVINKSNHRLQYLIKGHTNTVLCAEYWHPYIASAGKDNVLKLWKINDENKTISLLANYNGHSGDILSLAALINSKIIATVSQDFTIKLWTMCCEVQQKVQIKSAIRTAVAHQKSINAVRVSPKEDMLVTCSQDRTLKIWNINLTNIMTLVGHKRGVWDAAFHPIELMIVSAGGDGMLKGWSLQTGDCLWSIGEGPALIRCSWLYYNQVVTGSLSGIVKIWDIRKQTSLSYDKHQGKIWAIEVSKNKDGKAEIMSGATDSVYHVWQDNTSEMKETIMHEHQLQEQQRIFYDQHMANKRYCEAALIAFKSNYTKLFMNVLDRMSYQLDPEQSIDFDQEGKLMINQGEEQRTATDQQFDEMVTKLKDIDLPRLLITVQAMASTVKLYKVANKLLISILKKTSFTSLMELNSKFSLPQQGDQDINQFNEKKSDFVKWLQNMIGYQQKHISRLQKYIIGSHWIQHLHKLDNPFSA